VRLWLDTETWYPLGTELVRMNGTLVGRYFYRDLQLQPTLTATDFTPAAFRK
jgi:outer membrane lipoprotein-sorting protein